VDLQAAFERDLRGWIEVVYLRTEAQARFEDRQAAERVVERQNRIYVGLIVVLAGSILLLPWAGAAGVASALVVLYVGALASSGFTALKIRRLERTMARYDAIRERGERAWEARPPLDPDLRAQLIRIINLSRIESVGARDALATELAEASSQPGLADWSPVRDARVLLREQPPEDENEE
jgi:hypothetical protein